MMGHIAFNLVAEEGGAVISINSVTSGISVLGAELSEMS